MLGSALLPAAAQQGDINAIVKRAYELLDAKQYDAALAEAQKLEAAVKAQFGTDHRIYGTSLLLSADVYRSQGKYAHAEEMFRRALTILEKALLAPITPTWRRPSTPWRTSTSPRASTPTPSGYCNATWRSEKALRAAGHPDIARGLHNLADVYQSQGRYADAEPLLPGRTGNQEKALGPDHPYVG